MKNFLHVGCGPQTKANIQKGFNSGQWQEVRFDIDPAVKPDLVGAMTDMSAVVAASMDALYSSHNIEHIFAHEVPIALREFHRVLNPNGFVVITCPDLQTVCEALAQDKLLES
jgi:predicted SAM-dependent methyltransferase